MQLIKEIKSFFGVKKAEASKPDKVELTNSNDEAWRHHLALEIASPLVADRNYLTLFQTVPEVFFPIDFIARRIAGAHFEIKAYKDDSIVYCSSRGSRANRLNAILTAPNSIQRFRELVYMHHVYKLTTGNAFMRSAMPDLFKDKPKWQFCRLRAYVNLRCAQLAPDAWCVYAGGGITPQSHADDEWHETEAKSAAWLDILSHNTLSL